MKRERRLSLTKIIIRCAIGGAVTRDELADSGKTLFRGILKLQLLIYINKLLN